MENLQTYSLTDSDFIPQRDTEATEWFEDASSNADWIDNYSDPMSTCSLTEESYALNTYESLHQRNKSLEEKWQDIEQKYENLLRDRERQSLHLLHEQEKVMKYQKKLQFIKSNSDVVNQLKEKYLSVKGMGKPLIERVEKASQTNVQDPNSYEKDVIVVVKRSELQVMKETLAKLKLLVDTHTIAYSNAERNKHETEIRQMHNTISHLKDTISKKSYYLDIQKQSTVERKTFEGLQKENENLKRILVKMEKRRQREQCFPVNSFPVLTDEENVLMQNLLRIYRQDKPKPNPKPPRRRSPALKVRSSSDRSSNSDGNESKDIGAFGNTSNANVIPVITLPNNSGGDKTESCVGHKKRYLET